MKVLTDRREIGRAMNFGKYPVLMFDLDSNVGSKAVVIKNSLRYHCTLRRGYNTANDGVLYLMTKATMLKADYGLQDYIENAEFASAPVISSNQEVCILLFSRARNYAEVVIVKSGRADPSYSSATRFE